MEALPIDCEAAYCRGFLTQDEAATLFSELIGNYEITDKSIEMEDGSVNEAEAGAFMFADAELTSFDALPEVWGGRAPWPASLATVRDRIQNEVGVRFQVARCIHYANGSEGTSFHSDFPAYGPVDSIASISLGAEREFALRKLSDPSDIHRMTLHNGSLLYMGENCQKHYQHALPPCEECRDPRINLTFRKYDSKYCPTLRRAPTQ